MMRWFVVRRLVCSQAIYRRMMRHEWRNYEPQGLVCSQAIYRRMMRHEWRNYEPQGLVCIIAV
jgi:hypothetical protein